MFFILKRFIIEPSFELVFYNRSKGDLMKIFLSVLLCVLCFSSCGIDNSNNKNETLEFKDFYNPQITESVYFERFSDTKHSIYITEDNNAEDNKKYIVEDVLIFRYAYDNDFVIYHWNKLAPFNESAKDLRHLNGVDYEITKDLFTVFDISNNEYFDFATQNEMLNFCAEKDININWIYSNGFSYETVARIQGDDIWSISKATSESLMGFVLKNDEIIYEGFISDIYSNKNILAFKLEVPTKNILEFRNLEYNDISVSFDKVIKQRRELLFLTEDIYYSQYIIIDTAMGTVTEYSNWFSFEKAIDLKTDD